jgi:hypothetical protein
MLAKQLWLSSLGVPVLLVFACFPAPSPGNRLTDADLLSVRGASPPNGCQEFTSYECESHDESTSTCQGCNSASQYTLASGTFYPDPGACASTGTRYKNLYSFSCDMNGPPNNKICPNGQSIGCTWEVNCDSGAIVNDFTCGWPYGTFHYPWNKSCSTAAPPVVVPGSNGNLVTRTSCRVCTTGAATNTPENRAAFNMCKLANP